MRALQFDGWTVVRITGGHAHLSHPTKPGICTVAMHAGTILPGTLKSIIRQAGLSSSASCEDAMSSRYTVLIYPDEGAYSVTVPALPGCVTWGSTLDEAVTSARDAIEGHVAALRETGQDVPEEHISPIVLTVDLAEREPAQA
jgi:predicted RNase H-like HicB family nuclease/predicted RNA binding protein YcfA (HicA-like mRNA interferase family)